MKRILFLIAFLAIPALAFANLQNIHNKQYHDVEPIKLESTFITHPTAINKTANPLDDLFFIKKHDRFQNPADSTEVYASRFGGGQLFTMGAQYCNYITYDPYTKYVFAIESARYRTDYEDSTDIIGHLRYARYEKGVPFQVSRAEF